MTSADRTVVVEVSGVHWASSKAVTEAVDALCLDLRGKALELVEGLGVEEGWLNAAILD